MRRLTGTRTEEDFVALYREFYEGRKFVRVRDKGKCRRRRKYTARTIAISDLPSMSGQAGHDHLGYRQCGERRGRPGDPELELDDGLGRNAGSDACTGISVSKNFENTQDFDTVTVNV